VSTDIRKDLNKNFMLKAVGFECRGEVEVVADFTKPRADTEGTRLKYLSTHNEHI
jgi:hypothetical protein